MHSMNYWGPPPGSLSVHCTFSLRFLRRALAKDRIWEQGELMIFTFPTGALRNLDKAKKETRAAGL